MLSNKRNLSSHPSASSFLKNKTKQKTLVVGINPQNTTLTGNCITPPQCLDSENAIQTAISSAQLLNL